MNLCNVGKIPDIKDNCKAEILYLLRECNAYSLLIQRDREKIYRGRLWIYLYVLMYF